MGDFMVIDLQIEEKLDIFLHLNNNLLWKSCLLDLSHGLVDAAGYVVDVGGCHPAHGDTSGLQQVNVLLPELKTFK